MAGKRTAASELNHDNWDQEEQAEDSGIFRAASKEELQRRVIRTGRRRALGGASQEKKSVFSAFSGFNKPAPTSFDFLSNLTNGAGATPPNGSSAEKSTGSPVGLFGGSPIASSTGILSTSPSTDSMAKPGFFGISQLSNDTKQATPMFAQTSPSSTLFGAHKSGDSKPESMFGMPPLSSASTTVAPKPTQMYGIPSTAASPISSDTKPTAMFGIPSKSVSPATSSASDPKRSTLFDIPQNTSPKGSADPKPAATFGIPPMNSETKSSSIFGIAPNSSTPMTTLKTPSVSSSTSSIFSTQIKNTLSSNPLTAKKMNKENSSDSKTQYYSKLKGLNESVSEWIKKHVNENPLCILTPIFKDYEQYLKELEEEHGLLTDDKLSDKAETKVEEKKAISISSSSSSSPMFSGNVSFGSTATLPSATNLAVFSTTSTAPTTTPFAFGTTPAGSAQAPFSFGIGNTFSFNANVQKPAQEVEEKNDDNDDEPPKVEFTPVAEENSVFEKKCKIFFKKESNFVDNGVGTLYLKTVENSSKYQLIVRANTSLATILLNFILSESIPTQRMGKNNVMVVCIPTPDAKPPPVPILIRVKTSEEADNLLETLNKYKK